MIAPDRLNEFIRDICRRAGCDAEEAAAIADHLVDANLTGHDSHGACKIPDYVRRDARRAPQAGTARAASSATMARCWCSTAISASARWWRGRRWRWAWRGRGSMACAVVALRRAHHIGRIGAWAEQCAAAGFASMHYVNVIGHSPYVAPFGGRDGRLATNPFCAAPAGRRRSRRWCWTWPPARWPGAS